MPNVTASASQVLHEQGRRIRMPTIVDAHTHTHTHIYTHIFTNTYIHK
jgi:hypothetical protein